MHDFTFRIIIFFAGYRAMDVRELGDRPRSNKPDRSNATWSKNKSRRPVQPQQVPVLPEEKDVPAEKHSETIAPSESTGRKRRSRSKDWTGDKPQVATSAHPWLVGILALSLCAFIGLLLFAFAKNESENTIPVTPKKPDNLEAEIAEMNLKPEVGPLPHVVALTFAKTADREERLALARDPERIAPLIDSFPEQAVSEIAIGGSPLGEVVAGELSILRFKAVFKNGDSRILFVIRTDEGPKVDWEAYARHSNALQRWMKEAKDPAFEREEETAEVRVHSIRDSYYNFRFSDEEIWQAYQLAGPDLEEGAIGYARAGSLTARILEQELAAEKRITLQLKSKLSDARHRQYEIEKVHALGWVKTEGDFEERWLKEQKN